MKLAHASMPFCDPGFFFKEAADGDITVRAIGFILSKLIEKNRWCVEFVAWDGLHGSTSRRLIQEQGYSAVLIEGNQQRFADLQKLYADSNRVVTRNQFVGFGDTDNLDAILGQTSIPHDFDFLTVDIDGNDWHVWNAVDQYRPKVVMIEFNPTIPPEIDFVQEANPRINHGCSLSALVRLGQNKNYELITVLGVNAFFVVKELFAQFNIADNSPSALWTNRDAITYFFLGYDGRVFLRGNCQLPWQERFTFKESQVQVLPWFLRVYPWTRTVRRIYMALNHPLTTLGKIACRLIGRAS
jgi:hypothetical protein